MIIRFIDQNVFPVSSFCSPDWLFSSKFFCFNFPLCLLTCHHLERDVTFHIEREFCQTYEILVNSLKDNLNPNRIQTMTNKLSNYNFIHNKKKCTS